MSERQADRPRVASARPEMTAALMARTGLDEDLLEDLVHRFYAKVRADDAASGRSSPPGSRTGVRTSSG